jgi:hypothetical protein
MLLLRDSEWQIRKLGWIDSVLIYIAFSASGNCPPMGARKQMLDFAAADSASKNGVEVKNA